MKIFEVAPEDLESAKQLQTIMQNAEIKVSVTSAVGVARALEWYRGLCIELGKGYKTQLPAPAAAPSEGFKIKEFNPGQLPADPAPPKSPKLSKKGKK